jgi:hypothetical protein
LARSSWIMPTKGVRDEDAAEECIPQWSDDQDHSEQRAPDRVEPSEEVGTDDAPNRAARALSRRVGLPPSDTLLEAVARQVGIPGADTPVDARELPSDKAALAAVMDSRSVFGRASPDGKQLMLAALQSRGHVVAMTGDGVNDVLSLKQADIGIAMGSGSGAARAVAQLTLLDGNFADKVFLRACASVLHLVEPRSGDRGSRYCYPDFPPTPAPERSRRKVRAGFAVSDRAWRSRLSRKGSLASLPPSSRGLHLGAWLG